MPRTPLRHPARVSLFPVFAIPLLAGLTACSNNEIRSPLVSAENKESLLVLDGAEVLDETPRAIRARVQELLDEAYTLVQGDVRIVSTEGRRRVPMSCSNDACTYISSGDEVPRTQTLAGFTTDISRYAPVTRYHGVPLAQEEAILGELPDYYEGGDVYQGWLEYNYFAVQVSVLNDPPGTHQIYSASLGRGSRSSPAASLHWTGAMVGVHKDIAPLQGEFLQGKASLSFDPVSMEMDAAFSEIHKLGDTLIPLDDMAWHDIPVNGGTFEGEDSEEDWIRGRFYGPNHEEVGGVFERSRISGAFGAMVDE